MKKLLIALAFAGASLASFAQTNSVIANKSSVATNSFWNNWFVQAGFDWNMWYSDQEHGHNLSKNPFKSFRSVPGFSVAVGKWFTPGLGLRVKGQGLWGRRVDNDKAPQGEAKAGTKYWLLEGDALFNLSNMVAGYNPKRVYNLIPFVGGGIGRCMSTDFEGMLLRVGILNQFRVSKNIAINVELGWNRCEGDLDGSGSGTGHGWVSHDNNIYAELGLTYSLGKTTWEVTPDVDAINAEHQAALDALNAKLRDAENENSNLRTQLKTQPKTQTVTQSVKELITTPVSVFFEIGKTNVASQKDLVNVRALAKYAKENNSKILVTGYADSATGTAEINHKLSVKRAEIVKEELIKMGIPAENISTKGLGGVEQLSPVSFNRRATVQITE